MHFDGTNTFNIIERVGLVAAKTLIHAGALLIADRPIHHLEMHHVVARRCLMALGTIR